MSLHLRPSLPVWMDLVSPLSSISDGSERWFYILFVTLMWLCEEASCVYLCCHCDWESKIHTLNWKLMSLKNGYLSPERSRGEYNKGSWDCLSVADTQVLVALTFIDLAVSSI